MIPHPKSTLNLSSIWQNGAVLSGKKSNKMPWLAVPHANEDGPKKSACPDGRTEGRLDAAQLSPGSQSLVERPTKTAEVAKVFVLQSLRMALIQFDIQTQRDRGDKSHVATSDEVCSTVPVSLRDSHTIYYRFLL